MANKGISVAYGHISRSNKEPSLPK